MRRTSAGMRFPVFVFESRFGQRQTEMRATSVVNGTLVRTLLSVFIEHQEISRTVVHRVNDSFIGTCSLVCSHYCT